jgi:hypothetical protein
MAKDPREEQRPDAERIPDDRPGRLDTDVDRVEDVDDDDLDLDDEDLDDDDEEDEDLEEV